MVRQQAEEVQHKLDAAEQLKRSAEQALAMINGRIQQLQQRHKPVPDTLLMDELLAQSKLLSIESLQDACRIEMHMQMLKPA